MTKSCHLCHKPLIELEYPGFGPVWKCIPCPINLIQLFTAYNFQIQSTVIHVNKTDLTFQSKEDFVKEEGNYLTVKNAARKLNFNSLKSLQTSVNLILTFL